MAKCSIACTCPSVCAATASAVVALPHPMNRRRRPLVSARRPDLPDDDVERIASVDGVCVMFMVRSSGATLLRPSWMRQARHGPFRHSRARVLTLTDLDSIYACHPLRAATILGRLDRAGAGLASLTEWQLAVDPETEVTDQNHSGGVQAVLELAVAAGISRASTV